jgi:hypothetical protein
MAMGTPTILGIVLTAVNSLLLGVLVSVWLRNYRQFGSTMVLGLLGFSAVLLVENLVGLFFFLSSMKMLYAADPLAGQVALGMHALELLAIGFLTYVTLK